MKTYTLQVKGYVLTLMVEGHLIEFTLRSKCCPWEFKVIGFGLKLTLKQMSLSANKYNKGQGGGSLLGTSTSYQAPRSYIERRDVKVNQGSNYLQEQVKPCVTHYINCPCVVPSDKLKLLTVTLLLCSLVSMCHVFVRQLKTQYKASTVWCVLGQVL